MNNKGFSLIEVVVGLFLLGLISIICLPMVTSTINNIKMTDEKIEIEYLSTSLMEKLKSHNNNEGFGVEIMGCPLNNIIDIFNSKDEITIKLPLDDVEEEYKYSCIIKKVNKTDRLWMVSINVIGGKNNVEVISYIPNY